MAILTAVDEMKNQSCYAIPKRNAPHALLGSKSVMGSFLSPIVLTLFLTGCSYIPHQPLVGGVTTASPASPTMTTVNGSIFQTGQAMSYGYQPMFEDRRPRNVGDTLTIVLQENVSASKSSSASANGVKEGGSITAFYTVLTEGDDQQDPIADSARAILDGHIVLSRRLAESGHYPAIDIEASISRAMTELIDATHYKKVQSFKQLLSSYQRNRDLVSVGAYAAGSDPLLDKAIRLYPDMERFLQQVIYESSGYEEACDRLSDMFSDSSNMSN